MNSSYPTLGPGVSILRLALGITEDPVTDSARFMRNMKTAYYKEPGQPLCGSGDDWPGPLCFRLSNSDYFWLNEDWKKFQIRRRDQYFEPLDVTRKRELMKNQKCCEQQEL